MAGKSPYLAAVQFDGQGRSVGEIVSVKIVEKGSNSLFGEVVSVKAAA